MRTVLVTGATGAIGSTLVPFLLREEGTAVRLLLRARSWQHLRERLEDLFKFWDLDPAAWLASGRVEAFRGDVSRPLLGLDESEYRRLTGDVTHIIHAAGNVRLNQPLEDARRDAVDPAQHIVALARACRETGRFAKLDFVSTVGVAGRMSGLVPEQALNGPRPFHNTYEAAKAEAEAFLLSEMERGLPATIHRPSMVVGDSTTGKIIHFQVFYYLSQFLSGGKTWGFVPDAGDVRLDIIPADYVARALLIASGRADAAGRVFHLCSGPEHALRLADMATRLREILTGFGERLPPLRLVRPAWFRALVPLVTPVVPATHRRALRSLRVFLAYLDEEQTFDTRRSGLFFSAAGLQVPRVGDYLKRIMGYYWAARDGNRLPEKGSRPGSSST